MSRTSSYITTVNNTTYGWRIVNHLLKEHGASGLRLRGRHPDRKRFFKSIGRRYQPNKFGGNEINKEDLMAAQLQDPDLKIAIYKK